MPDVLCEKQVSEFWDAGYLTVADAVSGDQLAALNADLEGWIDESRSHDGPYGKTLDDRPRFDVQPGHSAENPALRRVQSPTELSGAYLDVLTGSRMIEMLADLIGPNLRLHHSKINCKLPNSATVVEWHQDFAFDPHTNDDSVACLLFLDDITSAHGPLRTVPGSHKGPIYSHWQGGRFTGAVDDEVSEMCEREAEENTGPAGTVCFMHSRVLHASGENNAMRSRNLFISQIVAADAIPLSPNHIPSKHEGMILRGVEPQRIRSMDFDIPMPEIPETTFFDQQANS